MKTTKYKLAEQVQRTIVGGNVGDANVTEQELITLITQAFSAVVKKTYFQGRAEGENWINGNFIYSFDLEVVSDKSKLPESSVALPYDMQVYEVGRIGEKAAFIPVFNGFTGLAAGLDIDDLQDRPGYFVENSFIHFHNLDKDTKKVRAKIVAPIGQIDVDDEVDIPSEIQLEIVMMAVQMFQKQKAQ